MRRRERAINAPIEPPRRSRRARIDWGLVGFCLLAGVLELGLGAALGRA